MNILGAADVAWCIVILFGAVAFGITSRFRWIPRSALTLFLVYKVLLCIGFNVWVLSSDQDYDGVTYYHSGLIYAQMFGDLVSGRSTDYLTNSLFCWVDGTATTRFTNLSGLLLAMSGHSFMASNLLLCCLGAIGQLLIFVYLREGFPGIDPKYFYLILFHPSSAVWSSLLLKDTLGMLALGIGLYHLDKYITKRRPANLMWLIAGLYVAMLYRSFILVMIFVFALFAIWDRFIAPKTMNSSKGNIIRFGYVYVSLIFMGLLIYYLRTYGTDMIALQDESNQIYNRIGGGSTFNNVGLSFSVNGLLSLPVGVGNALLRPFPWEVTKLNQALAALENLVVVIVVLRGWGVYLFRLGPAGRKYAKNVMYGPLLMTLVCAAGVGLFSSNAGSISRYRIPLIPTFLAGPCVALGLLAGTKKRGARNAVILGSGAIPRRLPMSRRENAS